MRAHVALWSLTLLSLSGCGPAEDPPKDSTSEQQQEPTAPSSPTCNAEYEGWKDGPLLSDGCYACNIGCDLLQCRGMDDKSKLETSTSTLVDYTWNCATYKGRAKQYVSLSFRDSAASSCWEKTSEYISSGICL